MPTWDSPNLSRHHRKRLREDPGCFEALIGIPNGTLTESQYELRSYDAIEQAWAEYECEKRDLELRQFNEARAYYVDEDLVVAVTDGFRDFFFTCFHEHFDKPHGVEPPPGVSVSQKKLRYKKMLDLDEKGGLIRNLVPINGLE